MPRRSSREEASGRQSLWAGRTGDAHPISHTHVYPRWFARDPGGLHAQRRARSHGRTPGGRRADRCRLRREQQLEQHAAPSTAAPAPTALSSGSTALDGTVGPGFTITLTKGGQPVTTLAAGTYVLKVDDRAGIHNFHLAGPSIDVSTAVDFVGKKSFTITMKPGTYRFLCDPHRTLMHGLFVVS